MVEETREDSEPASLGAGEEQVLVLVEPKPESLNISFSLMSLGKASKPSVEELSKLEEDCITFLEDVLLKDVEVLLSLKDCCTDDEVEDEDVAVFGALMVSVITAPSWNINKISEKKLECISSKIMEKKKKKKKIQYAATKLQINKN